MSLFILQTVQKFGKSAGDALTRMANAGDETISSSTSIAEIT